MVAYDEYNQGILGKVLQVRRYRLTSSCCTAVTLFCMLVHVHGGQLIQNYRGYFFNVLY